MGRVKMFFPGGNTCLGFFSLHDSLFLPEPRRVFIIKGGPGTGKATFMGQVAAEARRRGYDLELHWCSSDPASLDAVVVPALGLVVLDGTAPHTRDPSYTGACEEILNFGEYWDTGFLRAHREEVVALTRRVSSLFAAAYENLALAARARAAERRYWKERRDEGRFFGIFRGLVEAALGAPLSFAEHSGRERCLFASAVSPAGVVHHLPSLLEGVERIVLVRGRPGSGREEALRGVVELGEKLGYEREVFPCAFDPREVDLVVFPERRTAVLHAFAELGPPPSFLPGEASLAEFDFDACLRDLAPAAGEPVAEFRDAYSRAFRRALLLLEKAKQAHDELERLYVSAMDFPALGELRERFCARYLAGETA